jgi:hypothetical protein
MILAARFALFTGDLKEASRISQKILSNANRSSSASSAFEVEAFSIQQWSFVYEVEKNGLVSSENKKKLQAIDAMIKSKSGADQYDLDTLMLWAKSRQVLNSSGATAEILNILNQVFLYFYCIFFILLIECCFKILKKLIAMIQKLI